MPANPPYYPTRKSDLKSFALNALTLITAAPSTYGLTAPDAVNLANVVNPWVAAYDTTQNPQSKTPAAIAEADQLQSEMTAVLRPMIVAISVNESVADGDKTAVGATVRSAVRSPVVAPALAPTLVLDSLTPGVANLRYANAATPTSKAAPPGCGGVQVWVAYGASAVANPSLATYVKRATKSPLVLSTAGHGGQTATVFVRWETHGGVGGEALVSPYSPAVVFPCV